jgi:hypothetical protein
MDLCLIQHQPFFLGGYELLNRNVVVRNKAELDHLITKVLIETTIIG